MNQNQLQFSGNFGNSHLYNPQISEDYGSNEQPLVQNSQKNLISSQQKMEHTELYKQFLKVSEANKDLIGDFKDPFFIESSPERKELKTMIKNQNKQIHEKEIDFSNTVNSIQQSSQDHSQEKIDSSYQIKQNGQFGLLDAKIFNMSQGQFQNRDQMEQYLRYKTEYEKYMNFQQQSYSPMQSKHTLTHYNKSIQQPSSTFQSNIPHKEDTSSHELQQNLENEQRRNYRLVDKIQELQKKVDQLTIQNEDLVTCKKTIDFLEKEIHNYQEGYRKLNDQNYELQKKEQLFKQELEHQRFLLINEMNQKNKLEQEIDQNNSFNQKLTEQLIQMKMEQEELRQQHENSKNFADKNSTDYQQQTEKLEENIANLENEKQLLQDDQQRNKALLQNLQNQNRALSQDNDSLRKQIQQNKQIIQKLEEDLNQISNDNYKMNQSNQEKQRLEQNLKVQLEKSNFEINQMNIRQKLQNQELAKMQSKNEIIQYPLIGNQNNVEQQNLKKWDTKDDKKEQKRYQSPIIQKLKEKEAQIQAIEKFNNNIQENSNLDQIQKEQSQNNQIKQQDINQQNLDEINSKYLTPELSELQRKNQSIKELETELMKCQQKKKLLDYELLKLDDIKTKSGDIIRRKRDLNTDIQMLDNTISTLKMQLRKQDALIQ